MTFVPRKRRVHSQCFRLTRTSSGALNLTLDDGRTFSEVQIIRAAPLSHPDRYLCFLDSTGQEICMADCIADLKDDDRLLAEQELRMRYLTTLITKVISVRREAATSYWETETNRGMREFVIQSSDETVRWTSEHRVVVVDVYGNRFEISNLTQLDRSSAQMVTENLT